MNAPARVPDYTLDAWSVDTSRPELRLASRTIRRLQNLLRSSAEFKLAEIRWLLEGAK